MSTPQSAPAVYAVLTGDIIASSGMSAETLSGVRAGLQEAAEVFCNGYKSSVEARMDRAADIDMYRGDGWQLLLTEQALALRLALFLRATLRAKLSSGPITLLTGCRSVQPSDRVLFCRPMQ